MSRLHLAPRIALHVWHGSSGYVRSDRWACRAGSSKAVLGEGMPAYQDPSSRGKLIIEVQLLPVRPIASAGYASPCKSAAHASDSDLRVSRATRASHSVLPAWREPHVSDCGRRFS